MKKIKLLSPILSLSALASFSLPIVASCAKKDTSKVVPTDHLKVSGCTLEGVADGKKLTDYNELIIPDGIVYINDDCFNGDLDYSTIKTLTLPSSLREVGARAFKKLTNISTLDLSNMDANTLMYVTFKSNDVFETESFNTGRYCKTILPEDIDSNQKEAAIDKFNKAGIPDWWFETLQTGNIEPTKDSKKDQSAIYSEQTKAKYSEGALATNYLTLSNAFDNTKYTIEFYAQKTASTDASDTIVMLNDMITFKDTKTIEASVGFVGLVEKNGHEANYDINVICRKKVSPTSSTKGKIAWVEKLEGFKLTYVYQM